MQAAYFKTVWSDVKNTPGWLKKMFLLALVCFIPILGQIVVSGYLYGWARDIAWGFHGPMPERIFGNEDGRLYSRGFYIMVLGIALAIVPILICSIGAIFLVAAGTSSMYYGGVESNFVSLAFLGIFGLILSLVYTVLIFVVIFIQWVGAMRISIYGQLSAGFQFKKIWLMIRKDFLGLLKIFGMTLLLSFLMGIIVSIIFFLTAGLLGAVAFGGLAGSGASWNHFPDSSILLVIVLSLAAVLLICALSYLFMVPVLLIQALTTRALGYWTQQFDVPAWRGWEDPLPFELR